MSYGGCLELLLGLDPLRSCNAHPLATFAARKLLALLVGEPDRYAAGAFSHLDKFIDLACHASTGPLVAYNNSLTATILRGSHSEDSTRPRDARGVASR